MSMTREALQYVVELRDAKIHEVTLPDGTVQMYSDKPLTRLAKHIPMAKTIEFSTLSSFVQYIKSNVDTMAEKMIIHVVSPKCVRLISQLNEERDREMIVEVNAQVPEFSYGKFIDHETFVINAQAKFLDDPDTDKGILLRFSGTVEHGTVAEYGDDGVTQKATVRQGIASKVDAVVPNPVRLRPFRTFVEAEQPVSEFIFRMKQDKYDGIQCAIFEADGGAWKNAAMKNIHNYLEFELTGYDKFVIIS